MIAKFYWKREIKDQGTGNKAKLIFAMGLTILLTSLYLPYAGAQQHRNLPADWQLEQKILPQLLSHHGQWVGMTSCDHNVCKVDYLGPTRSNPYGHGISKISGINTDMNILHQDTMHKYALDHNRMEP